MDIRDKIKEKLGSKITGWHEHSSRRVYLNVSRQDIFGVAEFLFKQAALRFSTASATQIPSGFEIVYHFSHDASGTMYSVRVLLEGAEPPAVDSITPVCSAAEWIEREMWEMMGVNFKNHPNLKRLLLAEDWPDGNYPLRKKED